MGQTMTFYAFRSSDDQEFLSILAEVTIDAETGSPPINIQVEPYITIGSFARATIFVTTSLELAVSLYLMGHGTDYKEGFRVAGFEEDPASRNFELIDFLTTEPVDFDLSSPDLEWIKDRYRKTKKTHRRELTVKT
jgi:hypothetical protein